MSSSKNPGEVGKGRICAGFGAGGEQALPSRVSSVPGHSNRDVPSAARRVNSCEGGARKFSSRVFGFVWLLCVLWISTDITRMWGVFGAAWLTKEAEAQCG